MLCIHWLHSPHSPHTAHPFLLRSFLDSCWTAAILKQSPRTLTEDLLRSPKDTNHSKQHKPLYIWKKRKKQLCLLCVDGQRQQAQVKQVTFIKDSAAIPAAPLLLIHCRWNTVITFSSSTVCALYYQEAHCAIVLSRGSHSAAAPLPQ